MKKRFGQVLFIKPEKKEEYKEYHKNVWPKVLERIRKCNLGQYSVFMKDNMLFAYFIYNGHDFEKDMESMAKDPEVQKWWAIMETIQVPLETRKPGEWWANMEEVFYFE